MATPKLAAEMYKRLLHPVTGVTPPSKRILEDVSGVWLAMEIVCKHKGAYVPGLAKQSGPLFIKNSKEKEGRGCPRTKGMHDLAHEKRKAGMHANFKAMRAVERKIREDGFILSGNNFMDEMIRQERRLY